METVKGNNSSEWNGTLTDLPDTDKSVDITRTDFGLASVFIKCGMFLITSVACILNGLVIYIVSKREEKKLPVKFLLLNSLFADILLALSTGTNVIIRVAALVGADKEAANLCGRLFYNIFAYFGAFYQAFATLAVSFDRLYSVWRPLSYHTFKYSATAKFFVIVIILCASVGLALPILLLRMFAAQTLYYVCESAFAQSFWSENVLPFLLLACVCITISTYGVILVILVCHQGRNRAALSEGGERIEKIAQQRSLIVTFFLIHLTYIVLYVPSLLYFSFLGQHLDYQPELNFFVSSFLATSYLLNAVVDPVVYILRIRFVRERFRSLCCCKAGQKYPTDTTGWNASERLRNTQSHATAEVASLENFRVL